MFGFLKKDKSDNKELTLLAPCDGTITDITGLDDPVFSQKILGDGFAAKPLTGGRCEICSPADGRVTNVQDTLHAYCIEAPCGAEILVHIGINTVSLAGKGFSAHVKSGDRVKAGQPLCTADLDIISENGLDTSVAVVVTNPDEFADMTCAFGECRGGETAALTAKRA